jgi:hypothetical protein
MFIYGIMIGYKKPLGKAMMGHKKPMGMHRMGMKAPLVERPTARMVADALQRKVSGGLERRVLKR